MPRRNPACVVPISCSLLLVALISGLSFVLPWNTHTQHSDPQRVIGSGFQPQNPDYLNTPISPLRPQLPLKQAVKASPEVSIVICNLGDRNVRRPRSVQTYAIVSGAF